MTDVAKRVAAYLVLGGIALYLLIYAFSQLGQLFGGGADERVTAASAVLLAEHPALVRIRQQLQQEERDHLARSTQLQLKAAGLRHQLDSILADTLPDSTAAAPKETDWHLIALHYHQLDSTDVGALVECRAATQDCEWRADSAEREADRLSQQLDAQRKIRPRPCSLGVGAGVLLGQVQVAGRSGFGTGYGLTAGVSCQVFRIPLF